VSSEDGGTKTWGGKGDYERGRETERARLAVVASGTSECDGSPPWDGGEADMIATVRTRLDERAHGMTRARRAIGRGVGRRALDRLALPLTLVAVLGLVAATAAALWTPGTLEVATASDGGGHERVAWVAPDSMAASAGAARGEPVVGRRPVAGGVTLLVARPDRTVIALGPDLTRPTPSDLLDAALGLWFLLLGGLVLARARPSRARNAFWAICLTAGLALGMVAGATHGLRAAQATQFVALRLSGPALLALALAFPLGAPVVGRRSWWRVLCWLPALALVPTYPLLERYPDALAPPSLALADAALLAYIVAAGAWLARLAARGRRLPATARAQLRLLALGVGGGFAPFILLTLVPRLLTGHEAVVAPFTILPLALLPFTVAVAIAQTEFLGVTSLVHRRTLRMIVGAALLGLVVLGAWVAAAQAANAGWSPAPVAASIALLATVGVAPAWRAMSRRAERLFLRDAYDTGGALLGLSVELDATAPNEVGAVAVERLGTLLDLSFVLLASERASWWFVHPPGTPPAPVRAAVAERACVIGDRPPLADSVEERVDGTPVLFLPVADDGALHAVLALGPKRGGDRYTAQDRALLAVLARHLSTLFANGLLRADAARHLAAVEDMVAERAALTAHLVSSVERERRQLASLLHDTPIHLGHEVIRRLGSLDATDRPGAVVGGEIEAIRGLAGDLVHELRVLMADLYPPPLEITGLVPALRALLRDAERDGDLVCVLEVVPEVTALGIAPAHAERLFAIVREAVRNAQRHAAAATISVALDREGADLHLRVYDDGRGFVPRPLGALLAEDHLGLALLGEKAHALGGHHELTTAPGQGTAIHVWAPLAALTQDPRMSAPAAHEGDKEDDT